MILVAPGTELVEGGVYRARGSLRRLDPVVRGYYATQGIHLQLRAAQAVQVGRRGGLWGAVDAAHRYVLARLGAAPAPSPARALVAGIALGDTGGLPYSERESLRASGLYHVVAGRHIGRYAEATTALGEPASLGGSPVSLLARPTASPQATSYAVRPPRAAENSSYAADSGTVGWPGDRLLVLRTGDGLGATSGDDADELRPAEVGPSSRFGVRAHVVGARDPLSIEFARDRDRPPIWRADTGRRYSSDESVGVGRECSACCRRIGHVAGGRIACQCQRL